MTKDTNQSDPSIWIEIGTRTDSTDLTGITMILRKKNRRRRNSGVTVATVKTTADMTITGRRTDVAGSTKINDTRSSVRTNPNHLVITDVRNKTKRS